MNNDNLRGLVDRATFLHERLGGTWQPTPHPFDAERVERRLDRWCQLTAGDDWARGDWNRFAQRLSWDGLELETVRRLLGAGRHTPETPLPDWANFLALVVESAGDQPAAEIVQPFVDAAQDHLAQQAEQELSWLTPVAQRSILAYLTERLSLLSHATLADAQSQTVATHCLRYPVLARQLAQRCLDWMAEVEDFLLRLGEDWPALAQHVELPPSPTAGIVHDLLAGLSDPHRGGRTVWRVELGGVLVAYKPKNMQMDQSWAELMKWAASQELETVPGHLWIIARQEHGWMEWAQPTPHPDVCRLAQNVGGLLALLHLVHAADCHAENLAVQGDAPLLLDAEMLVYPQFTGHEDADPLDVMRTGLLPRWTADGNEQDGIFTLFGQGVSVPTAQVIEGYRAACDGLTSAWPALGGEDGVLARLRQGQVRVAPRPTAAYLRLLAHLKHQAFLTDGIDFSIEADRLAHTYLHRPDQARFAPLLAAEHHAIARGDIPLFHGHIDHPDLPGFLQPGGSSVPSQTRQEKNRPGGLTEDHPPRQDLPGFLQPGRSSVPSQTRQEKSRPGGLTEDHPPRLDLPGFLQPGRSSVPSQTRQEKSRPGGLTEDHPPRQDLPGFLQPGGSSVPSQTRQEESRPGGLTEDHPPRQDLPGFLQPGGSSVPSQTRQEKSRPGGLTEDHPPRQDLPGFLQPGGSSVPSQTRQEESRPGGLTEDHPPRLDLPGFLQPGGSSVPSQTRQEESRPGGLTEDHPPRLDLPGFLQPGSSVPSQTRQEKSRPGGLTEDHPPRLDLPGFLQPGRSSVPSLRWPPFSLPSPVDKVQQAGLIHASLDRSSYAAGMPQTFIDAARHLGDLLAQRAIPMGEPGGIERGLGGLSGSERISRNLDLNPSNPLNPRSISALGGITWISAHYQSRSGLWQHGLVGEDLYAGRAGISLFLAALAHVTGEGRWRDLALAGFAADDPPNNVALDWGGRIYARSVAAQLLAEPSLVDQAQRLAQWLPPVGTLGAGIAYPWGMLDGEAGIVLALLGLYAQTAEASVLSLAAARGQEILRAALAWTHPQRGLGGFSHGAAGIAYTLCRLHRATADGQFLAGAEQAWGFQQHFYTDPPGNWQDRRGETPVYLRNWCNGAAGIGLAAAACVDDLPHLRPWVARSAELLTADHPSDLDTLCCGQFGQIESLLEMGLMQNRQDWIEQASTQARRLLSHSASSGAFQLYDDLPSHLINPGFFRGVAGIGYTLLRLAVVNGEAVGEVQCVVRSA
ncbi:DUF4135 domain-containing protein [bacterium]|nr:DUF4135 domain-containing protein [bacterium]